MDYRVAICDDCAVDVEQLSFFVRKWAKSANVEVAINTFPSSEAFLFHYAENPSYGILLLDIEMGDMNGIDLAKRIRAENEVVQIIFITGFPDFLADGYDVSALHYLMKPIREEKLFPILDKAIKNCSKAERSFLFNLDGESIRISAGSILYAEAFAHKTAIYTVDRSFELYMSISEVDLLLGDGFIRCHRSYVVGLKFIRGISKTEVTLDNGVTIPVSRSHYSAVNQAFIRYFKGDA